MHFSDETLSELVAFAGSLADASRRETLPRFRAGVSVVNKDKAAFDPVTDADREAERILREIIGATYAGHGVLGEEFGETKGAEPWRWVIDPVDGTRAFVCGVASWATLIALEHRGAPVAGIIDQPHTDERWIGSSGLTRFTHKGETRIAKTSGVKDLAKARVSTTDPRSTGYFNEAEASAFARVADAARVARFSLDAYAYGLLALGELDLVIESSLKRHDYAALIPVIEGAGGVVTNWRGEPPGTDTRGEFIAAATPELHAAALKLLQP
ncbi:MAG: inositol monophosphatase family protein [Parvularculaceae bacterium]